MNTRLLKMARRHFRSDLVPRELNRRNMRRWVAAVRMVGPNWRGIATPLERAES